MNSPIKAYFQSIWGTVIQSQWYHALAGLMAGLPLVDIVTDYSFIYITLTQENSKLLEKQMAWISLAVLYLSSRLVLSMWFTSRSNDVTVLNSVLNWIPFVDFYFYISVQKFYFYSRLVILFVLYLIFLITVPLTHLLFVVYCVFNQMKSHFFEKRDFASFGPLTFLEIFESLPQLIIQTIIFFSFQVNRKGQQQLIFILSSMASLLGMGKATFMYYQRYAVVKRGFIVESIDDFGYIVQLLEAGIKNKPEILKVIHQMKAQNMSFQKTDKLYGMTLLMWTSRCGFEEGVNLLLQFGADHAVVDKDGKTALIFASRNGHEKVVDLLLQAGADHSAVDEDGKTDLIFESSYGGADHLAVVKGGATALIYASGYGHEKVATLLLQSGADHAVVDKAGMTALMFASRGGHEKVAALLLQSGADHSAVDEAGMTALMFASKDGHEKVAALLLQAGADHSSVDDDRKTALMYASSGGYVQVFETSAPRWEVDAKYAAAAAVDEKGAKYASVADVDECGHAETVDLLLKVGADHAVMDKDGMTALMYASRGHEKSVDLLLQSGADHADVDKNGKTALMLASRDGHEKVAALLLQAGADHSAVDKEGMTAVMFASRHGHEKVVDLLLQSGANHATVDEYAI